VPRVTGLRPDRADDHVLVELDGRAWRRLPLEVAARAGLALDVELGRSELRRLRTELRRFEALAAAGRALRFRDHSREALDERLAGARVPPAARASALDTLARAGVVDDARVARIRAAALAGRGSGDELIRNDLRTRGIAEEIAAAAVDELEPERERAIRLVAVRGETPATARWLARRGFDQESIEAALPEVVADEA
jgi:SOS response regulatory protein OraA/RecX